jgi:ATP-dependent DNA helicase RecQ
MRKEKDETAQDEELEYDKQLLSDLKSLRLDMADREHVPAYNIVADTSLIELAIYLPENFDELKHITGFGDYKIGKYGASFLKVIKQYAEAHNLPSRMQLKKPKNFKKESAEREKQSGERRAISSTMQATFKMFKEGMGVAEIAVQRNLATSTIETHLAAFIATGDLDIHKLVPAAKLKKILEVVKTTGQTFAAKPIKDLLPDDYSYGEIKMAQEYYRKMA